MKVTDIKQQVKRRGRYSIYIDGKYSFSLSESELLHAGIRISTQYDAAALERLKKVAVVDKAYMRSLDYLARRPRSEWEVRDYLKRKEYDEPTITLILNKLSEKGYVDDARFATSWVANRRALKPTSQRRLRLELQQKHVDSSIIDEALLNDEADERAVLKELVQKKRSQSRYQDPQKLIQYLARQGFRYDDIKAVLTETEDEL